MNIVNQHCETLAKKTALQLEEILTDAITNEIGDGWHLDDLVGRVQRIQIEGDPKETFVLDGKPILEIWPIEITTVNEDQSIKLNASRNYRTLN